LYYDLAARRRAGTTAGLETEFLAVAIGDAALLEAIVAMWVRSVPEERESVITFG
jgi:hypothetical protein